jgi:hypothetical protein
MKNFVIATVSAVALLSTAAIAEENSATMMKEVHQKAGEHCPSHHKKHHHAKMHHKGKHHHHVDRGHRGGPLAVYVNYPPLNVAAFSACPCEYYQGNQACGYIYHEGYYWYPQMRADLLIGYQPHQMQGQYWYPSRLHPHAVYVEMQSPMHPTLYAVPIEMAGTMHHGMHKHHGKKHHRAHHKHHGHPAAVKHHSAAHHGATAPMAPMHPAQPGM